MNGEERRDSILKVLRESDGPVSGSRLAGMFSVSRQVIVQDIALIRASGPSIISTARGYILMESHRASRVFKVVHTDEQVRDELQTIVDLGGSVEDVFIYHRVYGVIRGQLKLASRRDIDRYMEKISGGSSHLLKNTTSGYHYHTITADSEETLDLIQKALGEKGYLAKLQMYEPVDFERKALRDGKNDTCNGEGTE